MTTVAGPPTQQDHAPDAGRRPDRVMPPPKLRRRPMLVALGIALVVLGGMAAAWLVTTAGNTVTVLAVRADVDRGEVIGADDLVDAELPADPVIDPIPSSDLESVVGTVAARDLTAGSILTRSSTTRDQIPAVGQSIVAVTLTPGQLPSTDLRSGDVVRIVNTPRPQDDLPQANPASIDATVVGVRTVADLGQVVVDVSVPSRSAADLAVMVGTGRVAVILDGATP
jgi:hypothetical protein